MSDGTKSFGAKGTKLIVAASGAVETESWRRLVILSRVPDMWSLVPYADRTVRFRRLAFRVLSRIGVLD